MNRRILLLAPVFTPSTEIGARRWHQSARLLAKEGWVIDVITARHPVSDTIRSQRLSSLPQASNVFEVPLRETSRLHAPITLLNRVRRTFHSSKQNRDAITPSPTDRVVELGHVQGSESGSIREALLDVANFEHEKSCIRRFVREAKRRLDEVSYDVLVSSGPPQWVHQAAREIKKSQNLPWIMDMRDPWADNELHPRMLRSAKYRSKAQREEGLCVAAATAVLANTAEAATLLKKRFPWHPELHVVRNGADGTPVREWNESSEHKFRIVHAGSLFEGRDPSVLLEAMGLLRDRFPGSLDRLRLQFVGSAEGKTKARTLVRAEQLGVSAFVEFIPGMPHAEFMQWVRGTAALLALQTNCALAIPGKLYEYVQLPAWVIVVAPPTSAVASLLAGRDALWAFNEPGPLADALAELITRWSRGERPVPLNEAGDLDRRVQTEILSSILERVAPVAEVGSGHAAQPSGLGS